MLHFGTVSLRLPKGGMLLMLSRPALLPTFVVSPRDIWQLLLGLVSNSSRWFLSTPCT